MSTHPNATAPDAPAPDAPAGPCRSDGPPIDVPSWRRCRLLEAGFPEPLASRLAAATVDLHALLQLVDRGCPPELAARILAPLGSPLSPSPRSAW